MFNLPCPCLCFIINANVLPVGLLWCLLKIIIIIINVHKKWFLADMNMKLAAKDNSFPVFSVHINISKLRSGAKLPLFANPLTYFHIRYFNEIPQLAAYSWRSYLYIHVRHVQWLCTPKKLYIFIEIQKCLSIKPISHKTVSVITFASSAYIVGWYPSLERSCETFTKNNHDCLLVLKGIGM